MGEDGTGFGARLRSFREAAGLSQQELAERSGISVRALSNMERGRTHWPYRDSLGRIADGLGLRGPARSQLLAAAPRRFPGSATDPVSSVMPRQLPARPRGFTGRHEALKGLSRLVDVIDESPPVAVVTGMGGVGKTALVLHWAHDVADRFPDGQLFIDLRGFDPSGRPLSEHTAARALVEAFGVPAERIPQSGDALVGLYRSLLAGKRLLLVLDNARDGAQVRPLLPGTASCRVVVTSRSQLTDVIALEGATRLVIDVLTRNESRELMACRLDPELYRREEQAVDEVIGLCGRLPLALTIAAARIGRAPDACSPGAVAARVRELRDAGAVDALSVDDDAANLRSVFSWSYRTLSPAAARLFRLLGEHPGPDISVEAASHLAGSGGGTGSLLSELVRAHLVIEGRAGRYRMHDLLRAYAGWLAVAEEPVAGRREALTRVLDYYVGAGATAANAFVPSEAHRHPAANGMMAAGITDAASAFAWFDGERANLVAMAAACRYELPHHVMRLSPILFRYLDARCHTADALIVHDAARRAAATAADLPGLAVAERNLGSAYFRQARYAPAYRHLRAALAVQRRTGDRLAEAYTLHNLGVVDYHQGRNATAADLLRRALALKEEIDPNSLSVASTVHRLAVVELRQRQYRRAYGLLKRALAMFRASAGTDRLVRSGVVEILTDLGIVAARQGRLRAAAALHQTSLAAARELGDSRGEAHALLNWASVERRRRDFAGCHAHLRGALAIYREIGARHEEADTLVELGETHHAQRLYEEAADCFHCARRIYRSIGDQVAATKARAAIAASAHRRDTADSP